MQEKFPIVVVKSAKMPLVWAFEKDASISRKEKTGPPENLQRKLPDLICNLLQHAFFTAPYEGRKSGKSRLSIAETHSKHNLFPTQNGCSESHSARAITVPSPGYNLMEKLVPFPVELTGRGSPEPTPKSLQCENLPAKVTRSSRTSRVCGFKTNRYR